MTVHVDRIVLVFPIEAKGRKAAASLQTLEIVGNREFEELVPIDPLALADYAPAFNLATIAERDAALLQIVDLQSQITSLTAEVERLTALVPPPIGPRQVYPRELLARLTFAEVVAAIRTDDDAAIYAVANLQTTVSPVDLDSEETRTLIGALVVAGVLTPERLAEILA
jgi:hypothetical protein